ncbi:hypothetical protein Tco_1228842 [Tanacetum coccineum]
MSLFPEEKETKRSISENSSSKVESQSDRRRRKSLSLGLVSSLVESLDKFSPKSIVNSPRGCGDFLVEEKIPSIRRISGSKTLSSFPEGNKRKVSISEGSIKRRESLTNEKVGKSSSGKNGNLLDWTLLIMNIPGSKIMSLFPKGNKTKRSISENSSSKVESQSDRRRRKSFMLRIVRNSLVEIFR